MMIEAVNQIEEQLPVYLLYYFEIEVILSEYEFEENVRRTVYSFLFL